MFVCFWHRRHKFYDLLWSRELGIRIVVNQPYMELEHLLPSRNFVHANMVGKANARVPWIFFKSSCLIFEFINKNCKKEINIFPYFFENHKTLFQILTLCVMPAMQRKKTLFFPSSIQYIRVWWILKIRAKVSSSTPFSFYFQFQRILIKAWISLAMVRLTCRHGEKLCQRGVIVNLSQARPNILLQIWPWVRCKPWQPCIIGDFGLWNNG